MSGLQGSFSPLIPVGSAVGEKFEIFFPGNMAGPQVVLNHINLHRFTVCRHHNRPAKPVLSVVSVTANLAGELKPGAQ